MIRATRHSVCMLLFVFASTAAAADRKGIEFFESKIRPVLLKHCYRCHSADAKRIRGGLRLDTRDAIRKGGDTGPAVVPKNIRGSLIVNALQHKTLKMPPSEKLPDRVIADFVHWIGIGAPDPRIADGEKPKQIATAKDLWSLQPIGNHPAPSVKNKQWPASYIDRFLLAKLEANGLLPNQPATRETLLRRASFDLIGLPPTPTQIDDFLADDSPDAFAKVVDRLLASPMFGQRWGRHWLDVARFAESAGQSRNISYRAAWRYRNWVIDAFNRDLPYDRFITEQLAGDLLPAATQNERERQSIATGFLIVGPRLLNESNKSLVFRMGVVDDQIDTTFRAMMGLTVGCARCHDHKFDPISTREYHGLAGIFRSTRNLAGVQSNNNTIDNGLFPLGEGSAEVLKEIAAKQKAFEDLSTDLAKARRAKQALEQKLRDLIQKKGDPKKEAALKKEVAGAVKHYQVVARERIKTRNSIPPPPPSAMAAAESNEVLDCELFVRGDVKKPGPKVPRGTLQLLDAVRPCESIGPKESGRLQLARWIADRRNPLTARVLVNRIWRHLFGEGLVLTVDNFGLLGQRPSHPQLLDTLATRFMDDGWSIKKLIRRIMLSRSYQMSSDHSDQGVAIDPGNRLYWRMSRRRLEGEAIRDAMLAVAGRLDTGHIEGSVVSEMGMFEMQPTYTTKLRESYKPVRYRSVYLPVMRAGLPDMLKVFDAPDPSLVSGDRAVTTVAPQALLLLNDLFVREQATATASRVALMNADSESRIRFAFRLILGRDATAVEAKRIADYLASAASDPNCGWTDVCHVLMATAEFRMVY